MSRHLSTRNISFKSMHAFLSRPPNLAHRQTDKHRGQSHIPPALSEVNCYSCTMMMMTTTTIGCDCGGVEELSSMGVRLRLYGCERMRRERMIGECIVSFSSLPAALDYPLEQWLTLEPRSNLTVRQLHFSGKQFSSSSVVLVIVQKLLVVRHHHVQWRIPAWTYSGDHPLAKINQR